MADSNFELFGTGRPNSFGVSFSDSINISGDPRFDKGNPLTTAPINRFGGTQSPESPRTLDEMMSAPINRVGEKNMFNPPKPTEADKITESVEELTDVQRQQGLSQAQTTLALAGAKFFLDTLNANSAYRGLEGATQLNILESRRMAADAVARSKQRALDARSEGILAGEATALSLAAQGQEVDSQTVGRAVGSVEEMGIYNALQEEIAGFREALGFQLEEVSMEFQLDQARIDRDMQIFSSGLNLAATGVGLL